MTAQRSQQLVINMGYGDRDGDSEGTGIVGKREDLKMGFCTQ